MAATRTSTAPELALVTTQEEIRDNIATFTDNVVGWSYGRNLFRTTSYWIANPDDEVFGPSKFVGFADIDTATYDAAREHGSSGAVFDGTVARQAIESVVGKFFESDELSERLVAWAESVMGEGILAGVDDRKWRFLVLPKQPNLPGRLGRQRRLATRNRQSLGRPYQPVGQLPPTKPGDRSMWIRTR